MEHRDWQCPACPTKIGTEVWQELWWRYQQVDSSRKYPVVRSPESRRSRTKWQSISICLVRSWKTGFLKMCRAAWLSQKMSIGVVWKTPMAARKYLIQMSSLVTVAMARYSASADEQETSPCFFVFQDMGDPPRATKKPVRERLESGHAPLIRVTISSYAEVGVTSK